MNVFVKFWAKLINILRKFKKHILVILANFQKKLCLHLAFKKFGELAFFETNYGQIWHLTCFGLGNPGFCCSFDCKSKKKSMTTKTLPSNYLTAKLEWEVSSSFWRWHSKLNIFTIILYFWQQCTYLFLVTFTSLSINSKSR